MCPVDKDDLRAVKPLDFGDMYDQEVGMYLEEYPSVPDNKRQAERDYQGGCEPYELNE
jgi:hypothetical protein